MKTRQFFLPSFWSRSITMTRLGTPIWTAARPMPSAAYMLSAMSSSQLADLRIHLFDVGGDGFQARVGRGKDRADGHGREIRRQGLRVKDRWNLRLLFWRLRVVAAALIVAFARPKAAVAEPPRADPRLDTVLGQTGRNRRPVHPDRGRPGSPDPHPGRAAGSAGKAHGRKPDRHRQARPAKPLSASPSGLSVIDEAQKNISELSGQVVSLQADPFRQAGARRLRARTRWKRSSRDASGARSV